MHEIFRTRLFHVIWATPMTLQGASPAMTNIIRTTDVES